MAYNLFSRTLSERTKTDRYRSPSAGHCPIPERSGAGSVRGKGSGAQLIVPNWDHHQLPPRVSLSRTIIWSLPGCISKKVDQKYSGKDTIQYLDFRCGHSKQPNNTRPAPSLLLACPFLLQTSAWIAYHQEGNHQALLPSYRFPVNTKLLLVSHQSH